MPHQPDRSCRPGLEHGRRMSPFCSQRENLKDDTGNEIAVVASLTMSQHPFYHFMTIPHHTDISAHITVCRLSIYD
jgi:hypothetical protein